MQANVASRELFVGLQWGTSHHNIGSSMGGIDTWDAGAISHSASEFLPLNGRVRDLVSDVLGAVDESSGN